MVYASTCCTNLVPQEVIKGKDEIISRYSIGNKKLNTNLNKKIKLMKYIQNLIVTMIIIIKTSKLKQPPPNILEIENRYNVNNNNNNINSISSTYHNNKQNDNPSMNYQKIKYKIYEEKKNEEEFENNKGSHKSSENSKKSKPHKESKQLNSSNGDQYAGEIKNVKPNGRGHYISASGDEREAIFLDGMLNREGIYKKKNGIELYGNFIKDLLNGEGKIKDKNGEIYLGQFKKVKK